MPARETLLERIAAVGRGGGRSLRTDRAAVLRSVVRNVHGLMNTRQGSAGAQLELGIPSPHELFHDYPASLTSAVRTMRACIQRYEPRLIGVVIEPEVQADDALSIRFKISGRLLDDESRQPLTIHTSVDRDGEVRILG